MKKAKLVLSLKKETIVTLEKTELQDVVGGRPTILTTILETMNLTVCGYCVSVGNTRCCDFEG